ncbi:DNA-binding transcriptional LysR family regulator [Tamaricihabitans halophyticus]|uniref:DNA-binding transcriptional LysR family regulator n=1 Tax=Tamaricihabitans halophyticus TaxID=1262583 RepID=A0A4R2QCP2_9PSEU|nr:LysR substrate-binding domain-containing protein [Tamaricihabitans halophyticus]TCP46790.1 DNA-binding transcriptional LysR family regulator [Tamaricihabitans halophyticus]
MDRNDPTVSDRLRIYRPKYLPILGAVALVAVGVSLLGALLSNGEGESDTPSVTVLYEVEGDATSATVTILERNLGVQLFLRRPRGVVVTPVGRRVLADARRLLSGVTDLQNAAREAHESMSGSLVIGCYSTLSPIVLPPVIAAFAERHPDVDLTFVEGSQGYLREQLRSGELDLAVLYHYDSELFAVSAELVRTRLVHSPPYVLLPADHRLTVRSALSLRELQPEPMILFDLPPGGEYFRSLFVAEGLEPTVRFRTTSFEMVRALVARGLGYSVLSQRTKITSSYEQREFVTRPLSGDHGGLDIDIVQLRDAQPTLRADAFIQQCHESVEPLFQS